MRVIVSTVGILLASLTAYVGVRIYRTFIRRPATYPTPAYLSRLERSHPGAARMVCLGDSLTQGDLGASYVKLLEQRFPAESWAIMNAGINGDLSGNVLARVGDVTAARPALVTVLVGTNDIHCSMSPENYRNYVRLRKVSEPPTFADYRSNVAEIVRRLQEATAARIALMSIPLISEDADHEVNRRGDEYSGFLRELAAQTGVDYLPLREAQKAYLAATGRRGGVPYEDTGRLALPVTARALLGLSWDRMADRIGNELSVDNIHSNSRTAGMIADLIEGFVRQDPAR